MRHVWRLTLAVLVAAVAMLTMATVASADSIKYHSATASIDSAGNLVCSFRATGLGTTTASADVSCTADGTAEYACVNGGQNHPKAANKETVGGPVGNGGEFPVRNGQVSGSITVAPVSAGSFSCPSGQRLVLASVSYSNIIITVEGVPTSTTPSSVSRTLISF